MGVNGDDGGVSKDVCDSNGLLARYGDNGGRPRTGCRCNSIGFKKKSPKLNIFLLAAALLLMPDFKFESDVEIGLRSINKLSSDCFIVADRQLNELDRLLANFEGNWNISNVGESRRFGDKR